jgi:pimeloyl-ACP methyl ester carboxylesterase
LTGEVFLTIKISPRRIGYEEETLADSDEVNLGGRRCSRPQGTWRWPQILAGRGLAAVSVAIDPAPFRGVLPLPVSSLKSAFPVLGNPANSGRAVTLTLEEFKYGWANALSDEEAAELYEQFHVAAPGAPLFEAASANLNPFSEVKVKTKKAEDRGPLLLISGEKDHTVPWAITNSSYKRQKRNDAITEITEIADRGHSLTIDHGWEEVAQTALDFVQKFAPAAP